MRARLALVISSFVASGPVVAQPSVSTDAIREAWERRQAKVQSVRVEWNERRTWTKGCLTKWMTPMDKERAARHGKPGLYDDPAPPEDMTLDCRAAVLIEGNKMRYEHDSYQWAFGEKKFVLNPVVSTFDGKTGKVFHPLGSTSTNYPDGSIRNEPRHYFVNNIILRPVVTAFRGTDPWFVNYDTALMRVTGRSATIEGRSCVEVEIPPQRGVTTLHIRLWLDPGRDFVLVRHLSTQGNKSNNKVDIRYRPDAVAGWVPSSWSVVSHHHDGTVDSSYECTVKSIDFGGGIGDGQFDIEFPPGSFVYDLPNKNQFVVKPSGRKREIVNSEMGSTYEEIMATDTGELVPGWRPWYRRVSSYLYAGAVLAGLVLVVRVVRWRYAQASA